MISISVRLLRVAALTVLLLAAAVGSAHQNYVVTPVVHSPALAQTKEPKIDWSQTESANCLVMKSKFGFKACNRGDPKGVWNVAFIGDSHMRQYFADLDFFAKKYNWRVTYISKSACPVSNHLLMPGYMQESCRDWNKRLEIYLDRHPRFDLVINSNSAFDSHANSQVAAGFRKTVLSQVRRGTFWFIISDNPKPRTNFMQCIAQYKANAATACALPYNVSMQPRDVLPAAIANVVHTSSLNLRTKFCPDNICSPIINGIVAYRDFSHISAKISKTLVGYLDAAIPDEFKHAPTYPLQELMVAAK